MPHFAEMVYHLGGLPVMAGIPFGVNAKYYFVDPANGSDSNDGLSLDKALKTLLVAEDKCVANQHDTVFYIGGSSSTSLTAQLLWDKNYTHLIGICSPTRYGQRARIFSGADLSPLMDIQATGCIFKNFYINHGYAASGSLINVRVTGSRNYFENIHFAGGGSGTNAIDGACSLYMNAASSNTFRDCTFGLQSTDMATGGAAIVFGGTGSKQNFFEDCYITLYIDSSSAVLVELMSLLAVDRINIFKRCIFSSGSENEGTTMASAFVIPISHTKTARILLMDCAGVGFTDWDADNRGIVYLTGGTATAGTHTGLFQVSTT
jgi:hypothetical protein